jgi:hypothetical protein
VFDLNLIDLAIEYAAKAHKSQYRKGTDIPYVSHPLAVGMILLQAGCKEDVVTAGILHDTLEDTDAKEEELLRLFGPKVLDMVKGCSEPDKGASWEERKQHTLDSLKHAPLSIRQVACADKLHNLRSIKRDLSTLGEKAWDKFNRGRESQQWYYTEMVESLGYGGRFRLLDTFQDEVEELFHPPLENENGKKLRTNKVFFDLAFETISANSDNRQQIESRLNRMGGLDLIHQVHSLSYPLHPDFEEEFNQTAAYLQHRGIEFQSNSEGPIILIGFCAVLKRLLNLHPHEVYHHVKRNVKKGVL